MSAHLVEKGSIPDDYKPKKKSTEQNLYLCQNEDVRTSDQTTEPIGAKN